MTFISDNEYCSKLMEELWNETETRSEHLDTMLELNGSKFFAHSCVLSIACSSFFKVLHKVNEQSKQGDELIPEHVKYAEDFTKIIEQPAAEESQISSEEFQGILKFLYTGQIQIPEDKFKQIKDFAQRFEIISLLDICKVYEEKQEEMSEFNPDSSKEEIHVNGQTDAIANNAAEKPINIVEIEEIQSVAVVQNDGRFRCLDCYEVFADSKTLSKHYATQHNVANNSLVPCMQCAKLFPDADALIRHKCSGDVSGTMLGSLLSDESMTIEDDEPMDGTHSCVLCSQSFKNIHAFIKHEEKHKCKICNKVFDTVEGCMLHQCSSSQDKSIYECTMCKKTYTSRQCFINHQNLHKGNRGIACPFCKKMFIHRLPLRKHLLTHTNADAQFRHTCKVCNEKFRLKIKLYAHCIRVDHLVDEVPYKCKECPMIFPSERDLNAHERLHGPEKPFSCEDCDKRYNTKQGLQFHINSVHLKKLLYKCAECGNQFAQQSHLNDHKRVHTKERKYVCSFCGQGLCTKVNLRRHESMHTGMREFSCLMCEKKFAIPHDLKRHVQMQHSATQYVCDKCGVALSSSAKLRRHVKRLHADEGK